MSLVFTKKLKNTILAILLFKLFLRDFKRTTLLCCQQIDCTKRQNPQNKTPFMPRNLMSKHLSPLLRKQSPCLVCSIYKRNPIKNLSIISQAILWQ